MHVYFTLFIQETGKRHTLRGRQTARLSVVFPSRAISAPETDGVTRRPRRLTAGEPGLRRSRLGAASSLANDVNGCRRRRRRTIAALVWTRTQPSTDLPSPPPASCRAAVAAPTLDASENLSHTAPSFGSNGSDVGCRRMRGVPVFCCGRAVDSCPASSRGAPECGACALSADGAGGVC